MASATAQLPPNEKITLGPAATRLKLAGTVLGVGGLAAAVLFGALIGDGWRLFFHSYLHNFTFFLSLALGALFFVVLQHLVRAKWSVVVRRLAECVMGAFPVLLLLSLGLILPLWGGNKSLYLWSDPAVVAGDHLLHGKASWLDPGFFAVRILVYFAFWLGVSHFFFKNSVAQDESGDPKLSDRMRVASGPVMIGFALTTAFASFDLLMSLYPHWFSTIFGVYYFAGSAVGIFALLSLMTILLHRSGRLTRTITVEHQHDLGKLLFAFVFFWAYIGFSQFMLIWAANLPEETEFFRSRMFSEWRWISIALIVGHFAIPFVGIMSRNVKRRWWLLGAWATWMLAMHWVDLFWLVFPAYDHHHIPVGIKGIVMYGAMLTGMGGLFLVAVVQQMGKVKLVPVRDPGLPESLRFENI
jgi:hypothetical protein